MNKFIVLLALLIGCLSYSSCNKSNRYLERAIQGDVILSPLIYSEDSAIILISITSSNIVREIESDPTISDGKHTLYESIKSNSPIRVSTKFYKEYSSSQIYTDSLINVVYSEQGVSGLLDKYFKEDGSFILYSSENMFPIQGETPIRSFGENHNVGYIAYLLSKHDIYLNYIWLDEDGILTLTIAEYSDMNDINTAKTERQK